jgi:methionine aminotransferase
MPHYQGSINSKLPQVGTTIFSVMSALAAEHGAINLSQGFPDFKCSPTLVSLVNKYMKQGANQYAPMAGLPALKNSISEKTKKLYGAYYHPDNEITVTAGGTQAIYTAITAILKEGDEAILFDPAYDCYGPTIELCGATPKHLALEFPAYKVNWENVKKLINQKTRMIVINTPNNPTGSVLDEEDMKQLDMLTRNTDIVIVSDEVYEHIIYDGAAHQSLSKFPHLAERSFIISSFGKTFHTTGWKIGYCLAPKELMTEFKKVHQFNVFSCNTPIQYALNDFLQNEKNYLSLPKFYQKKRDYFAKLIAGSRFEVLQVAGTYFQLLRYSKISDEADTVFAERLTREHKIASIPLSVFYKEKVDHKVLRFCFAKETSTLEEAAETLCKI